MFIFYNLIFLIISTIYLPIYFFRKKFHRGFFARLGFLPKGLALKRPIWVHAVSVGEAVSVRGLIEGLKKVYPDKRFVISTVTPTGNRIAKLIAKEGDFVTYLPLDFSFIIRSVINKINPEVFIIAETEIWPNLISYLYAKQIPVITVNGRISDNSFKGYLSIKLLIRPILEKFRVFCVQGEVDRKRLNALGVAQERISVTGNMKFDISDYTDYKNDYADYKKKLGLAPEDKILVAASTHAGEEEIILAVYKELLNEFNSLKLLIAPRHPQRGQEIAKIVSSLGFRSVLLSGSPIECSTCIPTPVFILDSVGELMHFYNIADIVFVGGSLVNKGGHNILEPVSLGKPVLFGPCMSNFRDIADLFLTNKAAISVNNREELKKNIAELLQDPVKAGGLNKRAQELILKNQGATARNIEHIRKVIVSG